MHCEAQPGLEYTEKIVRKIGSSPFRNDLQDGSDPCEETARERDNYN